MPLNLQSFTGEGIWFAFSTMQTSKPTLDHGNASRRLLWQWQPATFDVLAHATRAPVPLLFASKQGLVERLLRPGTGDGGGNSAG